MVPLIWCADLVIASERYIHMYTIIDSFLAKTSIKIVQHVPFTCLSAMVLSENLSMQIHSAMYIKTNVVTHSWHLQHEGAQLRGCQSSSQP